MATWLRSKISGWGGRADNSPGLPTHVPPAPLAGPPLEVVVVNSAAAPSRDEAPASFVIDVGPVALHQPPSPAPKLQGRATAEPVLPLHHTGEVQLPGSSSAGSPAIHRASRRLDPKKTPQELSEQDCLAKLHQLESDRPSGLRDAEKAFYKIMLAKKTADPTQARLKLLEARQHLDFAQRLTQDNTFFSESVKKSEFEKIQEKQTLLNQVAAELSISLDPEPSPVPLAPTPVPAQLPEKPPSHFSITYMVVGIIALLGVVLVGRVAVRQLRNIIKM